MCCSISIGDKKATEAAFAKAHAVAEISIVNPRIVTNYMETARSSANTTRSAIISR
jgi:carbon-monoxide dehydrogenase large subunit